MDRTFLTDDNGRSLSGMLVTLSGMDCAGKSTQIDLLLRTLKDKGYSVKVLWYRPGYSQGLDQLRRIVRWVLPGSLPTVDRPEFRQEIFSRGVVQRLWIALALIDTFLQYVVKLQVLLCMQDVVICDRYIYDAALDFALRFPSGDVPQRWPFRLIRYLVPKPICSFLLITSREVMLKRMSAKAEPFSDPPTIRDQRFEAYRNLVQTDRFMVVDADGSIEEVGDRIASELGLSPVV